MKRQRKKYQTPSRPWDKERIEYEKQLVKNFGLKNKREIWKASSLLRKYRSLARGLIAKQDKNKEKILIEKLSSLGILGKDANLDNILTLTVEDFLNRRLQTVVHKKNLVNTVKQGRQFIVHGHVLIDNRKVTYPSYLVPAEREDKIILKVNPVKKIMASEENGEAS
ncbi:MAG: 30S ribosomal protein S4 [Candidatus Aenigmarchaeota archaeon]|nr:30S ribosomal protein S4 [Candidatus Aenigmarchaeota archaeon]